MKAGSGLFGVEDEEIDIAAGFSGGYICLS
jgi:hypothetical protein